MGLTSSKCLNCFRSSTSSDNENAPSDSPYPFEPTLTEINDSKFHSNSLESATLTQSDEISNEDSNAFSKPDLINLVNNAQNKFIDLLHADPKTLGFELILDSKGFTVHSKENATGYTVISSWNLPFTPQTVVKFMRQSHLKQHWDRNVQEARKVSDITPEISVFYQVYRKILMMSQRDMLVVSKLTPLGAGWLEVCSSIESPMFPERKSVVRARVSLGGYYIDSIEPDLNGNVSHCVSINETDFGGSVPKRMLLNFSIKHIPMYVKAMVQGIKDHLDNKLEGDG